MNKANTTDTEAPSLDLHILLQKDLFHLKYDKRDDFGFDIRHFPFFWMVTFLGVLRMVYTLLSWLEFAIMLRTSMRKINV